MNHSPIWLFDLDNTLHNAEAGIFYIINRAMTEYMAGRLKLSEEGASQLRQEYWHRYGATLAGLQIHHPEIDIDEFCVKVTRLSKFWQRWRVWMELMTF